MPNDNVDRAIKKGLGELEYLERCYQLATRDAWEADKAATIEAEVSKARATVQRASPAGRADRPIPPDPPLLGHRSSHRRGPRAARTAAASRHASGRFRPSWLRPNSVTR